MLYEPINDNLLVHKLWVPSWSINEGQLEHTQPEHSWGRTCYIGKKQKFTQNKAHIIRGPVKSGLVLTVKT